MDKLLVEVGRIIKVRRKARGLSQEKLAEATGLHAKYLGSVERGETNLTLSNLARIAAGLKCNIADLFSRGRSSDTNEVLAEVITLLEDKNERFLLMLLKVLKALD